MCSSFPLIRLLTSEKVTGTCCLIISVPLSFFFFFFLLRLFSFFFSPHPYHPPLPPTLLFLSAFSPLPGWNELLIASFSHRSVGVKDGLMLANDLHVSRETAHTVGVETIFDRYTFTQAHAHLRCHRKRTLPCHTTLASRRTQPF